jgi:oxygen-independent coproporphyrinogen-3 oxidase
MPSEFLFEDAGASRDEMFNALVDSEGAIPGLLFTYPPIPSWRPVEAQLTPEERWEGSDRFSHNLYIHIPFCKQKCSFCYYSVAVHADDEEIIWRYLRCLEMEAERYAEVLAEKKIETVFIGGGTPSRLNEAQIEFLFDHVVRRFDLSECREITYECSPDSATAGRIEEMVRQGTTRLSMGVQSLDPEILKLSRRSDTPDSVASTYYNMVDRGVRNVNIDLIAGIEREGLSNMEKTMAAVGHLDPLPAQITLFTLSIRERSINAKTMANERPLSRFRRSLALYRYAKRRMLDLGYWQFSRNLFPLTGEPIFHYQDNHWGHNGYVIGLGASSYSHSGSWTYMNQFKYAEYMELVEAGEMPVQKEFFLTPEESLRRHLSLALKHQELDVDRFNSFYGEDALALFETELEAMIAFGALERSGDVLRYRPGYVDLADRYLRLIFSRDVGEQSIRAVEGASSRDAFSYTV